MTTATKSVLFSQDFPNVRDFMLQALAEERYIWSNQDGFAASNVPNEDSLEGEWAEVSDDEALALCGTDSEGGQWTMSYSPEDVPVFLYGGNELNWMWLSEDGVWHSDGEGNTCEISNYRTVGRPADLLEEWAAERREEWAAVRREESE